MLSLDKDHNLHVPNCNSFTHLPIIYEIHSLTNEVHSPLVFWRCLEWSSSIVSPCKVTKNPRDTHTHTSIYKIVILLICQLKNNNKKFWKYLDD